MNNPNKNTNFNKKNLLAKEFELLIQEFKESGLEVNENYEEIKPNEMLVNFISKKKEE